MSAIPTFALYGEDRARDDGFLHWETITARSRLYGFEIAPHRHERLYQILHLASGAAELTLDNRRYALSGPALVVLPPMSVHGYRFDEDVDGLVLTFFARDVHTLLAEVPEVRGALSRPLVVEHLETRTVTDRVADLVAEADQPGLCQHAALRAGLMLLLLAIARQGQGNAARHPASRAEQLARAFLDDVERNFRERRAIGFYAARLGITPIHLNRVARTVLARSARAVIEERIVLEAKRYLQFSQLSIKEIAIVLGYPDPAYFSRFFVQRAGQPPSHYRLSQRG